MIDGKMIDYGQEYSAAANMSNAAAAVAASDAVAAAAAIAAKYSCAAAAAVYPFANVDDYQSAHSQIQVFVVFSSIRFRELNSNRFFSFKL